MDREVVDIHEGYLAPDVPGWHVYLRDPNGVIRAHAFPQVALDWRIAEYGLDTVEEALDIVLHEIYADPEVEVETSASSMESVVTPKKAKSLTAKAAKPRRASLYEAKSTVEAKEAHLDRIAEVKANKLRVTDSQGLLTHIKDGYTPDKNSVLAKKEAVDIKRWLKLYGGFPEDPIPDPSQVGPANPLEEEEEQ